jgi:hypothetical protein
MTTRKRLKWTGKSRDQQAGKFRVQRLSGAWTLSYDGERLSRHASKEAAKRKAGEVARFGSSRLAGTVIRAHRDFGLEDFIKAFTPPRGTTGRGA